MQPLTLEELDRESDRFDAHVQRSADLDAFCSSTDWTLPAALALMPGREPWLRRGVNGYVALMRSSQQPRILEPLEAMWGLACPVVGEDVRGLANELAMELAERASGDALVLCGLYPKSPRFVALAQALSPRYRLGFGPTCTRYCASLEGGLDGFLSRRSANFRLSIKRAHRRAKERGLTFERCAVETDGADEVYARVLAIEARSWKGMSGVGFAHSEMLGFYRLMLRRLARRGALRLWFARHEGIDVAYILGGLMGDTYRGLQFSFAQGWEDCSLGNLCQYHQIAALADEGVRAYDLGAEVEYKRRWGERAEQTVSLLALPSRSET
jgi:hypothetical protein